MCKYSAGSINFMANVAVLGSTGMLGSTLTRVLQSKFNTIHEFNRSGISVTGINNSEVFDVGRISSLSSVFINKEIDYIINCTGMIKQLINVNNSDDIVLAQRINSEFLVELEEFSSKSGIRVIQIGTDCVYSGKLGKYSEKDTSDPIDVYGITKNLGEKASISSMLIRCSIIGREVHTSNSLMEWVLKQPLGAKINGYTNHIWNGVTTLHFSQIVSGIIKSNSFKAGVQHLIPKNIISKYELLNLIAQNFERHDLQISKFEADIAIDRSLTTINFEQNLQFWQLGGYNEIPTIDEMVSTYSRWYPLHN
jgi:dTDP-4-dehydrorhamnose reductase